MNPYTNIVCVCMYFFYFFFSVFLLPWMRKSSLVLVIVQPVTLVLRQTQPEGSLTQRGDLCFKKKKKKRKERRKKNPLLSQEAGQSSPPPGTHPRPGCRAWWHQRRTVPAGWTPPPRSRRAWRGAGPGWCCTSRAERERSPRTPSPCRTTWEGVKSGGGDSAAHVTHTLFFKATCSWLGVNPALWFQ